MVSYTCCAKEKLGCKLSSLSKKCGNCEIVGAESCVPVEVRVLDFTKVESEIEKIEAELAATEAVIEKDEAEVEAAWARMKALRAKLKRLRK
jgi:capsule polysaccharide export protein KpsE/RkpR